MPRPHIPLLWPDQRTRSATLPRPQHFRHIKPSTTMLNSSRPLSSLASRRATPLTLVLALLVVLPFTGCERLGRFARGSKPAPKSTAPASMDPSSIGKAPAISAAGSSSGSVSKARSLLSQGEYDAALAEFNRAIESNPRLTVAFMGAADIYRQRGDYNAAQQNYSQAATIEPRNFNANYMNGLMLHLLNKLSEAVRAYLQALSVKPDDFNANLNLATAYLQLNEPQEALSYGQRAIQLNAKDAASRSNLGAIYAALNRHEEAVTEYQQAAELTQLTAPLLLNLAESLGKVQRYGEMSNTLQLVIKSQPTAIAYERLGFALFRSRQYPDALQSFRKCLEIDPNHFPGLNGVGVCLLNQWKFSNETDDAARLEALRALRRSIQIEPNQPKILELLGRYGR